MVKHFRYNKNSKKGKKGEDEQKQKGKYDDKQMSPEIFEEAYVIIQKVYNI